MLDLLVLVALVLPVALAARTAADRQRAAIRRLAGAGTASP